MHGWLKKADLDKTLNTFFGFSVHKWSASQAYECPIIVYKDAK